MSMAVTSAPRSCRGRLWQPPAQLQGPALQGRHFRLRAEQRGHRHLVFLKLRGEDAEPPRASLFMIIPYGLSHRVVFAFQHSFLHFSSVYSHKDTTNPSFSAFLCPTFLRGITKKHPVPRRSGQCPNRPEDTPRPANRPSPIGRDALRKPAQYFAQSTRVLCGEYNPKLRKASSRFPQRKGRKTR